MPFIKLWRAGRPYLPAGLWYGVIFLFSAQTGSSSGALSDRLAYRILRCIWPAFFHLEEAERTEILSVLTFCLRKSAHMAAYFLLAGLLMLAVRRGRPWRRARAVLLLCAVLAGLDEFHQTFVSGRSGQLRDVFIDLAGAGCFLLLWALFHQITVRRTAARQKNSSCS